MTGSLGYLYLCFYDEDETVGALLWGSDVYGLTDHALVSMTLDARTPAACT